MRIVKEDVCAMAINDQNTWIKYFGDLCCRMYNNDYIDSS
jgi:hypothetical protein